MPTAPPRLHHLLLKMWGMTEALLPRDLLYWLLSLWFSYLPRNTRGTPMCTERTNTDTYAHMYKHTHTHWYVQRHITDIYAPMYKHTYICTKTYNTDTYAHVQAHTHIHRYSGVHPYLQRCITQIHTHKCTNTCTHTEIHTCTPILQRCTYTDTSMRTNTHTQTHTYTVIKILDWPNFSQTPESFPGPICVHFLIKWSQQEPC